jgi:catalase
VWGQWTSSVKNHQASAEDVLGGMPNLSAGRQAGE